MNKGSFYCTVDYLDYLLDKLMAHARFIDIDRVSFTTIPEMLEISVWYNNDNR